MNKLQQYFKCMAVATLSVFVLTACNNVEEAVVEPEIVTEEVIVTEDAAPVFAPPAVPEAPAFEATELVIDVDGEKLTYGEMDEQVQQFMRMQGGQIPPQFMAQAIPAMSARVVESFVAQTVLTKEADRRELTVTPEEVDEVLAELKTQIPPGMAFEDAVGQMGLTVDDLRKNIQRDLTLNKLIEEETADIPEATDEEIEAFYAGAPERFEVQETVTARHIIIQVEPDASEEVRAEKRKQIEDLRAKIVDEGADFAEVAREFSEGPSAPQGGDLGSFSRGQMVPTFEEAVFTQEIDVVGPVVETQFGYHIIEVQEREEARTQTLDEVKEDIAEALVGEKKNEVVQAFIGTLREQATITYGPAAPEGVTGT